MLLRVGVKFRSQVSRNHPNETVPHKGNGFEHYTPLNREPINCNCGVWWRFGRVDAFRPKGHGFNSRSSCHEGTLGKFLTHSCLWRFSVKFRHSIRAVSGAPLGSSGLEEML